MKILRFAILVAIVVVAGASEEGLVPDHFPRRYRPKDYFPSEKYPEVKKKHITLYLYTKKKRDNPVVITILDAGQLNDSKVYNKSNENFFTIHGWLGDYKVGVNTLVRKAVLDKYDVNVFAVDWSPIACHEYGIVTNGIPKVGELLGDFIVELAELKGLSPSMFSLAGFSLGGHVAGAVGAQVAKCKSKISHIAGLDPAGPLFRLNPRSQRLDDTDAEYVQVIHTHAGILGYDSPMGHADYYPNGGTFQPGCFILDVACQHYRAFRYFAESITNQFPARKCISYPSFLFDCCNSNPINLMGGYKPNRTAHGVYELRTHDKPPYNMGKEGASPIRCRSV